MNTSVFLSMIVWVLIISIEENAYSNIGNESGQLVLKEIADNQNNVRDVGKELGQLYLDKKYDDLLAKADSILKIKPNDPLVNLLKGRVFVDKAHYRVGKPFIQAAIDNDSTNSYIRAWGLFYLAQIEHMDGDRTKAKDCLSNCIEMKATANVTNAAGKYGIVTGLSDYYKNWLTVETEHIVFLFQPDTKVADKNKFCELRENAFKTIEEFFKTKLPRKIIFIVWNGNEDAMKVGITSLGFSKPELCCIHSTPKQTMGHELTHVISHYLGINPIKTRFINEGMAVALNLDGDGSQINSANGQKVKEGNSEKISVLDAWNNPTKYPEWVYYSLAGQFVKRLISKGGDDKFLKLAVNQTYDNARSIYGEQLQEIISEFEHAINSP